MSGGKPHELAGLVAAWDDAGTVDVAWKGPWVPVPDVVSVEPVGDASVEPTGTGVRRAKKAMARRGQTK